MIGLVAAVSILGQTPELPALPPIRRDPQITYVDRNGQVLGVRGGRYAPPVNVDRLPAYVPAAFVSIEDQHFWEHSGFDPLRMAKALAVDALKGRAAQGASTITQQTAKLLFLSSEKSVERKATELVYAIQLEQSYSKKQILGLYLSRAYFGEGAYGLEAAAQRYFNKPAARLTIREAAMLASLMKSPTNYDPVTQPEANAQRARLVLDAMVQTGAITSAQRAQALAATPKVWKSAAQAPAQYFLDWIDDQTLKIVGRPKQDLVVETTLDLTLEDAAADSIRATTARYKAQGVEQAAVVSVDGFGRVWTMVGGTDFATAPYNRAVEAHRQAGSAWKPFVYLTALEQGRTPETPVVDEPVTIAGWSPKNYEEGFLGPITMQKALAESVNTVAARVADEVGRQNVAATARRLGIVSTINTDPAMALGTSLVTPLEMAQAYAVLANGGYRVQAYGVERIRAGGQVLYQHRNPPLQLVAANPAFSELTGMMRTVLTEGTGVRAAVPGYDLAGKTGTTSDYKDAWFCGFTGGFATVVWMGRDDNSSMRKVTGGLAPAEAWKTYMVKALKRVPRLQIPVGPPPPPPPPPIDPNALPPPAVPAPAATPVGAR
ncbi:transglycosylase domain-containing protein [Phenylobacterium soli]|uniref:Penicillin-binding protein n=1 Tax=Phenylobacterium soli TaxID=2170551 RepID=A0A328AIQ7_9CAUL|nr:PBP1A family penicillin-binding protein [Phenylobacterium soli]RAK54712.1 penicillin-binding protein [Phenylobacterium soli]